MGAGRSHLQRPLRGGLTPDLGEVRRVRNPAGEKGVGSGMNRSDGPAARQVVADLHQGSGATHDEVLNDTCFGQVVRREEQFAASFGTGSEGHREGTPDGAEVTLQSHLAQDHGMLQVNFRNLAAGQE